MPPLPTLQTLADAAGCSRMTVSRALRGGPGVSAATRARIRALADRLGYRPDPLVSALMIRLRSSQPAHRDETIAYLTTYARDSEFGRYSYLAGMQDGAAQRADELGFRLEEFNLPALRMSARRAGRMLAARGIRGLVVAPLRTSGRVTMDFSPFASVSLGTSVLYPDLHRIQGHHARNLNTALRELRKLRLTRVGLVLDERGERRTEHLLSALLLHHQSGRPASERVPSLILPRIERRAVLAWVRRYRPQVIAGFSFEIGWWLREEGLRPRPRYLNLNSQEGDGADFGIDQSPFRMGSAAVDLVVEQINANRYGLPDWSKIVMLSGRWKVIS